MLVIGGCSYDGGFDEGKGPAPVPGAGTDPGRTFGISVGGASYSAPATRAEYDGVTYRWTPGDRVGFYMVPEGGSTPVVSNARLKSVNTAASQVADFEGELMERDIEQISSDGKYDYYSYYPYDAAADAGFPNVAFNIPGEMTLTPDVFPVEYGFMVANRETTADGEKPLTWIEQSTGQQRFGKYVGFEYRHVFAYLEVYLSLNLMSQPINKVVVTCTDGSLMSGTANINLQTGAVSFSSGSPSITVNIAGDGLNIWEDNGVKYTKVWIPINPELTGKRFRFDFYSAVDARNTHAVEVWGGPLVQGMKHKAGFKIPFHVIFTGITSVGSGTSFSYKGYSFGRKSSRVAISQSGVELNSNFFAGDNSTDRGHLRTPALNLANTDGRTSIPVRMGVYAWGDVDPDDDDRSLQTAVAPVTQNDGLGRGNPIPIAYNTFEWSWRDNYNLTESTPCIIMRANSWGAYETVIREIRIEPSY